VKKKKAARRITLKAPWEIEKMLAANQIVARVLEMLRANLLPGVTTYDLDRQAEEYIRSCSAEPAFKGYRGYPATVCISINDEIVHGIPSPTRRIESGDLVSMDVGVIYDGYVGDAAISAIAGENGNSSKALELITCAKEALFKGIEKVKKGRRLGDVSAAIQARVESSGFGVVKQFVGHGIGQNLHEPPEVPNYGTKGRGPKLKKGMVIAIEPMVTAGSPDVRVLSDGWTAVTADGSLAAHYEHSVAVTDGKPLILSLLR
jgi:methionyl aminopeptidase